MTAQLLRRIGHACFGHSWSDDMARELNVNRRTVQRWAAGQNDIDPRIWPLLGKIMRSRRIELRTLELQLHGYDSSEEPR
jgi:hypothetical protein